MAERKEMKVLGLGLPRTGTLSMAHALTILGYENVHHSLDNITETASRLMNRAADASFPSLPSYTGTPFTREDWDEIYGWSEAVTESASLFSPQLIEAYPNAKVVLVIRDFDRWYASFDDAILRGLWSPTSYPYALIVQPILGLTTISTLRKVALGFLEAKDQASARKNARMIYDRHHQFLRERLPPSQLLEYRLGDGWGPLCKFLDKPVPEVEFPWINDAGELKKMAREMLKAQLREASWIVLKWTIGIAALGALLWRMSAE